MQDRYSRPIRYLRLSLTGACAMRCTYCRPFGWHSQDRDDELTVGEIQALVEHLATRHGVRKVRLTGGEPTNRDDLVRIVQAIAKIDQVEDLAMTTNALNLEHRAKALASAGLRRVNISLDSLDPVRFAAITGVDGLSRVMSGIQSARRAGMAPIRLNTVVVRGQNEDEIGELVTFAAGEGCAIRFIELMPMGPLAAQWKQRFVSQEEISSRLRSLVKTWTRESRGGESALSYRAELVDGRIAKIGFISAMSCPFCSQCDRIRIGSRGELYPCLLDHPAGSVLPALRPVLSRTELDRRLGEALNSKPLEHPAVGVGVMTAIGG